MTATIYYQLPENWIESINLLVEQSKKLIEIQEGMTQAEKKILEFTDAQNFTLKEVATITGYSIETLYKDAASGLLKTFDYILA